MKHTIQKLLFFISVLVALCTDINANTIISRSSGNWSDTLTWEGGNVPGPGTDVIIKAGHVVFINDSRSCAGLVVQSSGSLGVNGLSATLNQSGTADIYGNMTVAQGTYNQSGDVNVYGLLIINAGVFNQNGAITVSGAFHTSNNCTFVQSQAGLLSGTWNNSSTQSYSTNSGFAGSGTLINALANITFNAGSSIPDNINITGGIVFDNLGHAFNDFTLNGGVYAGNANSSVTGSFSWLRGNLEGSGVITSFGITSITYPGSGTKELRGSRNLIIQGTATLTNTSLSFFDASKFTVGNGGQLTIDIFPIIAHSIGGSSTSSFEIASGATVIKQGVGIITLNCRLNVDGGNLNINNGTFTSQGIATHTYNNADILINGGTLNHGVNASSITNITNTEISGTGVFALTGAIVNLLTNVTLSSKLSLTSTSAVLKDDVGISPSEVILNGGTYTGTGSPTFGNKVRWEACTFDGSGLVTVTDSIKGLIIAFPNRFIRGTKELRIDANGKGFFQGAVAVQQNGLLHITNGGTLEMNNASIPLSDQGKLRVSDNGQLKCNNSNNHSIGSASVNTLIEIQNTGTLTKTATGTLTLLSPLALHSGNIIINAGNVTNNFNGSQNYNGGSIQINAGFFAHAFTSGTSVTNVGISGLGEFKVTGGLTTFHPGTTLTSSLSVSGGTLTTNTDIDPSSVQLTGGSIKGSGNISTGNLTMSGSSPGGSLITSGLVTISGIFTWEIGVIGDAVTGGDVNANGSTNINLNFNKILRKKALHLNGNTNFNAGTIVIGVEGVFHIGENGVFNSNAGSMIKESISAAGIIINEGVFHKTATNLLTITSTPFQNNGTLSGLGSITFNGSPFTNSGTVAPGSSPGILSLNKFVNQNAKLAIEITGDQGAGQVNGHDKLTVTGFPAGLGGEVDINLINGFVPAVGQSYVIAELPSGYSPALFNLITGNMPVGYGWTVAYNPSNVVVTYCPVWYADSDGDTFGNPDASIISCSPPPGYVSNSNDCDDTNDEINPVAAETCNDIDDDCDGAIDDEDSNVTGRFIWYADEDGDGYGSTTSQLACTQPSNYVSNNNDCNDEDNTIHPGAVETCNGMDDDCDGLSDDNDPDVTGQITWYADEDGDGYGSTASQLACTQPANHVSNNNDCNDEDNTIHPGAVETCNGMDDDCDGLSDDNDPDVTGQITWYADEDGDDYGSNTSQLACTQPANHVSNNNDCDDEDNTIHPGAIETCNGVDDDCDGLSDDNDPDVADQLTWYADEDGDGYGSTASQNACIQPANHVSNNNDCNDEDNTIHLGAVETCNGMDDDCDGDVDEEVQSIFYADEDGDGFGNEDNTISACSVPEGYVLDNTDCNDNDSTVYPTQKEVCNAIDDDCDGLIDNDDPNVQGQLVWYLDADGDTFGNSTDSVYSCINPGSYAGNNDDCDDLDPSINPLAEEICNNLDDNCDGEVDERLNCGGTDFDNDGVSDEIDNCVEIYNPAQEDSDCDSVGDACDVCPGGDDSIDNNNDGRPDCKFPPNWADIIAEWKCSAKKVYLCHLAPNALGGGTTLCLPFNVAPLHIGHGDYLGPCGAADCSGSLAVMVEDTEVEENVHLHDASITTDTILANEYSALVSPNPSDHSFNVRIQDYKGQHIQLIVMNEFGQMVEKRNLTSPVLSTIIGQEYPTGVYTIIIQTDVSFKSARVIKIDHD